MEKKAFLTKHRYRPIRICPCKLL